MEFVLRCKQAYARSGRRDLRFYGIFLTQFKVGESDHLPFSGCLRGLINDAVYA